MVLRDFARFREVSQGLGCFCVVLHGFARFWVFLLGSVWFCVVPHGFARFQGILRGFVCVMKTHTHITSYTFFPFLVHYMQTL